jgi:transcriptional regulator with XRE-family HTH domain
LIIKKKYVRKPLLTYFFLALCYKFEEEGNMVTDFGKICRKIRIDNGEVLKDMAAKLNVTTAYLSAVEIGKRNVPQGWIELIKNEYRISDKQYQQLQDSLYEIKKYVKIDLEQQSEVDRELILEFHKNLKNLNDREKLDILSILQNQKKSNRRSSWESYLD